VDLYTPNIWQLQSRRDLAGLVEALRHADPDVRRRAAAALRTLDAAETVDALKEALRVELDWDAQASLTAAIQHLTHDSTLTVLIEQGNITALIGLLYSPEPEDVLAAIEGLVEVGDRLAVEPLVVLFHNDTQPDEIRYAVAEALIKLKSAPAVVTLLAALRRENPQVRLNAARVLGEIRARWATRGLIEQLDDADPEVRKAVEHALEQIGTPTALRALQHAHDESMMITLELPALPEPDTLAEDDTPAEDEVADEEVASEAGEAAPQAEAPAGTDPADVAAPAAGDEQPSPYRAAVNGLIEMLESGRRPNPPPASPAGLPDAGNETSGDSDDDPDGLPYPVDVAF